MLKYSIIIAVFFLFQPNVERVYYRQLRIASIIEGVEKSWKLTLKPDSSFNYTVHEIYSIDFDSTYNAKGTWTVGHDTLTLKTYTTPYFFSFVMKGNELIPIGEKGEVTCL